MTPSRNPQRNTFLALTVAYIALIVYGSLYPFAEWRTSLSGDHPLLSFQLPESFSFGDVILNIWVYVPLGLFLGVLLRGKRLGTQYLTVIGTGLLISAGVEYTQAYLPARTPSWLDVLLNVGGSALGLSLIWPLSGRNRFTTLLGYLREQYLDDTPLAKLGALTLLLWAFEQMSPLVPSLDMGTWWAGLKPLTATLRHPGSIEWLRLLEYTGTLLSIAIIALFTTRRSPGQYRLILLLIAVPLIMKVPIVSRELSLEALSGAVIAFSALRVLRNTDRQRLLLIAGLSLIAGITAASSHHPADAYYRYPFEWSPFAGQLRSAFGITDLATQLWPGIALGFLLRTAIGQRASLLLILSGGILTGAGVFALEWYQTLIPGRHGDITDVLLTFMGWLLAWMIPPLSAEGIRHGAANMHRGVIAIFLVATIGSLISNLFIEPATTRAAAVTRNVTFPAPEELPAISLPNFKASHPRLPYPSTDEIQRIRNESGNYLFQLKRRAKGGGGDISAVILYETYFPGSQDLNKLYQKLMKLEPTWRGHQQTKPLAWAYDWLYDRWSEQQRNSLRDKVVEACEYQIGVIRNDALSPYNVYLYNSPYQALMACAISVYQDSPRAEPVMRFNYDFWRHRVIPVWQQVMGKNGGWHEGGEYVGIGIGQAVYQLPNMWRTATGEDWFQKLPGLKGFLDFLVYRRRPDDTDFHWGDAGFYNRQVPDRVALAIEYRHAPAYALGGHCPNRVIPSSWPWGPLPDETLCRKQAYKQLPLIKYFDGIGLVVARSSWEADATYVTFKAGDNYWSHSHLDQGAFTIFKNSALAIDSGIYGSKYGSDHHMNYAYQSIAHNVVTVTDPEDNMPMQQKHDKPPRAIANDGGQRRLGSGWGKPAPLDRSSWQDQYDTYHTATILGHEITGDYVFVSADLTPAYSNSQSGIDLFSARTDRDIHLVRNFIYDRKLDTVIIMDTVSSRPELIKRWLLHTQTEPLISDQGFTVLSDNSILKAIALLPKNRYINKIGGPGFEYYVDGVNYDDEGEVARKVQTRSNQGQRLEPGEWRISLSPTYEQREDTFLVTLHPQSLDTPATPDIKARIIESDAGRELEITSGQTTHYWIIDNNNPGKIQLKTRP